LFHKNVNQKGYMDLAQSLSAYATGYASSNSQHDIWDS